MMRERKKFLTGVFIVVTAVLGLCELGLRYSETFSDYVYFNSSPRHSDNFRIHYRLNRAAKDGGKLKVAFIGSSITRDGIDVRLFEKSFPGSHFYNLGGTYKLPMHEAALVEDYAKSGVHVLVYWLSGSDIYKLHTPGALYYPNSEAWSEYLNPPTIENLSRGFDRIVKEPFAALSHTVRYRGVLAEAFENSALKAAGLNLTGDFDFFWQQQNIDDGKLVEQKLRYTGRHKRYFRRKTEAALESMNELAEKSERAGIRLIFVYSEGVCEKFRRDFLPHVIQAEEKLAEGLQKIAASHGQTQFYRLPPFACELYADMFHLNSVGRVEAFHRLSPLLGPLLKREQ